MNIKNLLKSGLVASLAIILSAASMVPVVGDEMDSALARFNLPPLTVGAMIFFLFISIIMGITLMFLYGAMLPRFKNRIKTIIIAVLVLWIHGCLFANLAKVAYGFMPVKLTVIGIIWGFGELLIAGLIGIKFYKE